MLQILLPAEVKTEAAMKKTPVLIKVFNNGYLISLLLFLAGSIASLCDGVIASRGHRYCLSLYENHGMHLPHVFERLAGADWPENRAEPV